MVRDLTVGVGLVALVALIAVWARSGSQPGDAPRDVAGARGDDGSSAEAVARARGPAGGAAARPRLGDDTAAVGAPTLRLREISALGLPEEKEVFVAGVLFDVQRNARRAVDARASAIVEHGTGAVGSPSEWSDELAEDMRTRLAEGLTDSELRQVLDAIGNDPLVLLNYELPKAVTSRPAQ